MFSSFPRKLVKNANWQNGNRCQIFPFALQFDYSKILEQTLSLSKMPMFLICVILINSKAVARRVVFDDNSLSESRHFVIISCHRFHTYLFRDFLWQDILLLLQS